MADGVRLVRAKEKTGMTYALLENYPYFKENLEMQRLYSTGEMGRLVFAEGEYVHPMDVKTYNTLSPQRTHWRNWTPRTYYSTHALAPLMQMTGATPTRVTAMAAFRPEICKDTALRFGDAAAIILCQTDTDAVFRVTGWSHFAPHGNHYRLCCTNGGVEVSPTNGKMRLSFFEKPEKYAENVIEYDAEWPDAELGKIAANAGHGGGDFFVIYDFVKSLEDGVEPFWNVYRATTTASVAILAWRSVLNGGVPFDIPDFSKEEDRVKYENDTLSPYPSAQPEISEEDNYVVDFSCSSKPYTPPSLWLENHDRVCRGEEPIANDLEKKFI
jgi:predicted dehydrogenase